MVQLTLSDISKQLTLDVINRSFRVKTNSDDNVKTIAITKAAPAGEGLISAVYRISVTGSSHKTSFIAKGLVRDLLLRKTLQCSKFFEREILFYSEILPLLKELQKTLKAKENIQHNVPICYSYYLGNDNDYLLMEDLSENAFKAVPSPNKKERDLTLRVLAHLHAVSMALRMNKPEIFSELTKKLNEIYYSDGNRNWYAKYLQNAIEIDKVALRKYESENSVYYKKFSEFVKSDVFGQLIDLVSYNGDHAVFNHGDAWLPNFMTSKERVVAIDFQLFRCASPVTDLTYYLSLCNDLCPAKFKEAVDLYHSFISYFLLDMGLNANEIFSNENLDMELIKNGRFGLLASLSSIPLLGSERCDVGLTFQEKFEGYDLIPLEKLWPLTPLDKDDLIIKLVNAVKVAVDMGFI